MEDVTETEFAAIERDAKSIIEASIDAVRDLEETDFAAEPRDAEVRLFKIIKQPVTYLRISLCRRHSQTS